MRASAAFSPPPAAPAGRRGVASPLSRPPLARMLRLHGLLQAGRFPNCRRLAEELEVSCKTVQRDIDFMRDQLELPIDYNAAERGFFYTRPVVQFPSVQISEGELVALFVARRALEQYRGTAFERPLRTAFEKLTAALPAQIGFAWEDFDRAVAFHPGTHGRGAADLRVFQTVSDAVRRAEEIEFDYHKRAARTGAPPERRRVQGFHLGCFDHQWYLIGQDLVRGAVRTFVLGRMERARNTRKRFARPAGFSVGELLAGSFGVFAGQKVERLRLWFDADVAQLVRERRWHPSQGLADLPDGRLELTLAVGLSPEVERWLLGWGAQVEVREPAALRRTLAGVAARTARRHQAAEAP